MGKRQLFDIDPQTGKPLDPQYTVFDLDGNPILVDGLGRATFYEAVFESGMLDHDGIRKVKSTNTKYELENIFANINCNIEELTNEPRIFIHPSGSLFGGAEINIGAIIYGETPGTDTDVSFPPGGIGGPNWFDGNDGTYTPGEFGNGFGGVFPGINFILPGNTGPLTTVITGGQLSEIDKLIERLRNKLAGLNRRLRECQALLEELRQTQNELELVDDETASLVDVIKALLACKARYENIIQLKTKELNTLTDEYRVSTGRLENITLQMERQRNTNWTNITEERPAVIELDLDEIGEQIEEAADVIDNPSAPATLGGNTSFTTARNLINTLIDKVFTASEQEALASVISTIRTTTSKSAFKSAWNALKLAIPASRIPAGSSAQIAFQQASLAILLIGL